MFNFWKHKKTAVTVADVVRHFIRMEASREKYANKSGEMREWLKLPDSEFIQKVHEFERSRDDVNPALLWTIGTKGNEISCWTLKKVPLTDLYTCGINSKMKADIDSVQGNLKRFADAGLAKKYSEFRVNSVPSQGDFRTLIGIAQSVDKRDGSIQIIDGCHRAIAMLANSIMKSDVYIGKLKR